MSKKNTFGIAFKGCNFFIEHPDSKPQWFKDKAWKIGEEVFHKVNSLNEIYVLDPKEFDHYFIRFTIDRYIDHPIRIQVGHDELTHDDGSDRFKQFKTFAHFITKVNVVDLGGVA